MAEGVGVVTTTRGDEAWRNVSPIPRSQSAQLAGSRRYLEEFLTERFEFAFARDVEEVVFESFPDGLYATLYVVGAQSTAHNVWAVSMSSALADAGVKVHVVVWSASARLEAAEAPETEADAEG